MKRALDGDRRDAADAAIRKEVEIIMEDGGQFKRTKLMLVRLHFIRQFFENKTLSFFRCPTDMHIADIGTKPHGTSKLQSLLKLLSSPPELAQEGV